MTSYHVTLDAQGYILDLPSYSVLDSLYADPAARGLGHRVAESIFDKKHIIFLRERMGPDLVYKP